MRDNDATSGQHVFDHPQAQGKTEIEPHRVGNDFSGKAVATVERITVCHASSSPIKPQVPLTLRCPNSLFHCVPCLFDIQFHGSSSSSLVIGVVGNAGKNGGKPWDSRNIAPG